MRIFFYRRIAEFYPMITFRSMIYFLTAVIIVLTAAIVALSIDFRYAKVQHRQKVDELNHIIVQLMSSNDAQLSQLRLSDELKDKLNEARESIDKDLMAIQHDLVGTLSKNGLID